MHNLQHPPNLRNISNQGPYLQPPVIVGSSPIYDNPHYRGQPMNNYTPQMHPQYQPEMYYQNQNQQYQHQH